MKENIVAIIPARGGSKGIPKKNLLNFCAKPLLAWSIEQACKSRHVEEVYVSTDSHEIAEVSAKFGAITIKRPNELSTDFSSSEEALLHAISEIEKQKPVDTVVFLQPTSPLREENDIDDALEKMDSEGADSLFSTALLESFSVWEEVEGALKSLTYDYRNRGRRQDRKPYYLENGSIYIFKTPIIKKYGNRIGGKVTTYLMPFWKSYEIDDYNDIEICEYFMRKNII